MPKMEKLLRVAAYARVSSGKDAMLHSLATQVDYYSNMIKCHVGWTFVRVYADEALTGTKDNREQFQQMLTDCRNGKIDRIITKSISRFARNTVTLLQTVRELRLLGIDVFFEEQNIHSMSTEGELMLTIMGSYAQEESRSASENQKWRIRKGFENGELMCLRVLYGYQIDQKEGVKIDPGEAAVVREIFAKVIKGESLNSIVRWLNRNGYYGKYGGKWKTPRLRNFISNEKLAGNALLQKKYVNNHIEKKLVVNHGELPQYYCTETHPAIIDQETFLMAQKALTRIANRTVTTSEGSPHIFSGMIICNECGKSFKRVKKHNISKWICRTYVNEGAESCKVKGIPEKVLMQTCCKLFDWPSFDEELFKKQIDHITAIYPNKMVFHFRNGKTQDTLWEACSRSESWTPEMKRQAGEYGRRSRHG